MTFSITNDFSRLVVAIFSAYWSHTWNFKNNLCCVFVTPIDCDTVEFYCSFLAYLLSRVLIVIIIRLVEIKPRPCAWQAALAW